MMSKSFCICPVMFSSVLAAAFALLFGWLSTFSVYCTGFFCKVVLFELFLTDLLANASPSHPSIDKFREGYLLEESEYPLNALRIRFIVFVIFIFSVTFIVRLKFIYFFSFSFVYVEVFTFCSTIVFVGI